MLLMDIRDQAVMLDTETTGNGPKDHVIDLAIVRCKNGTPVYSGQFRAEAPISPFAYKVHGMTERQLMRCPRFIECADEIYDALSGNIVLAWNVAYDQKMLEQSFRLWNRPFPPVRWACAMQLDRQVSRLKKSRNLSAACAETGAKGGDHSAMNDALAAARVLYVLANRHGDYDFHVEDAPTPMLRTTDIVEHVAVHFPLGEEQKDTCVGEYGETVGAYLIREGWDSIRVEQTFNGVKERTYQWSRGDDIRIDTKTAYEKTAYPCAPVTPVMESFRTEQVSHDFKDEADRLDYEAMLKLWRTDRTLFNRMASVMDVDN